MTAEFESPPAPGRLAASDPRPLLDGRFVLHGILILGITFNPALTEQFTEAISLEVTIVADPDQSIDRPDRAETLFDAYDAERAQIREAIRLHTEVTGSRPRGFYLGRTSMQTIELAVGEGGFDYLSDSYADDLPYWIEVAGRHQLVIPYTLDANDMRFATPQGFNAGDQFEAYLRDSLDALILEGEAGSPKMMSVGLHMRLIGHPARAIGLERLLDHMMKHEGALSDMPKTGVFARQRNRMQRQDQRAGRDGQQEQRGAQPHVDRRQHPATRVEQILNDLFHNSTQGSRQQGGRIVACPTRL